MPRILVVEDSEFDYALVRKALSTDHDLIWAKTKSDAESHISRGAVDLVLLDLVLGDENGLQFCTELRNNTETQNTPLIIISAKGGVTEKVMGLNLGADDYVTKPFEPMELKARIDRKIAAERQRAEKEQVRTIGPLKMSADTARAYIHAEGQDNNLDLSPTEFRLLWTLSKRDGQLYSRDQLIDAAYGAQHHITPRTIDSHIRSLRSKLGDYSEIVETVYGTGYRFNGSPLKTV